MFRITSFFTNIFVCLVGFYYFSNAQGINSPYSIIGLGDITPKGQINNLGMGGMGVSYNYQLFINTINPALLARNKLTVFESSASLVGKSFKTNEVTQNEWGGGLNYFNFAFPINAKTTMAIGLRPMSSVNYKISSTEYLPGTQIFTKYTYQGTGGINQVFMGCGREVNKNLKVGLQASFNFGAVDNESRSLLDEGSNEYVVVVLERTKYSDFTFLPGLAYSIPLSKGRSLNFGLTYDAKFDINAKKFRAIIRRETFSNANVTVDTLIDNQKGQVTIPQGFTFGMSYEKTLKYGFGVDVSWKKWSDYSNFARPAALSNSLIISAGGEFIPNYYSINNYFNRISYRAGVRYEKTPYLVDGIQLNDLSLSAGFSLPVGKGISALSFAAVVGKRGTTDQNLILERYFKFALGATVNDRWFVKRKFN